jgi:prepilin-type N-terminal cleavage/methylation domain-containing protein
MEYKKGFGALKAFSLVELLIAIAMLAVISLILGYVFVSHFKLFNNVKSLVEVSSSNKLVLDELISQIRESGAIASTCSGCGSFTTGSTTLILQLWPLDSNNIPFEPTTNNYDYIIYYRDAVTNTNLIKKIIPDSSSNRNASAKIMASDISNLTFTYNNVDPTLANQITVNVQNSIKITGRTQTTSQQIKAVLRNK